MKLSEKMGGQGGVIEESVDSPPAESGSIASRTREPRVEGGEREADPESGTSSQEDYDKVVMAASEVMFGQGKNQVLQMMGNMKDQPDQAIADTASLLIMQIDEKMGGAMAEDVMIAAAAEVAEELGALAVASNLFPVDQKTLQRAAHKMYATLGAEYDIDPNQVKDLIAEMSEEDLDGLVEGEKALYEDDRAMMAQQQQGAAMPATGGMQNG